MDIYTSGSGKSWVKKLEHFFRTAFLLSSSVLLVTIVIALLDKAGVLLSITERVGPILLGVWFGSFVLWILFLIVNSRVGRFIGRPISRSTMKKKKVGVILLYVWLVSLILFIISAIIFSTPSVFGSSDLSMLLFLLLLIIVFLLPVWGILLGNRLVKILVVIPAGFVALSFVIYLLILRPHRVVGVSMSPEIASGELILSEKVTYYFNSPKRGDVVVFTPSFDPVGQYLDRIVGLPGEKIAIRSGHVYINGSVLSEPYLQPGVVTSTGLYIGENNVVIPQDEYALLGDNRTNSSDSRHTGFTKRSEIESRIFYIYWPWNKKGLVK